jgi:serine/threonine protein kinase
MVNQLVGEVGAEMEGTPFGRYRLVELLGRGGMGEVWRAYDPAHDRFIAVKVLPANFANDQVFQERFRREARAAAGLDNPHVVPIHDSGEIDGQLFVSMKLIKGRDLHDILDDGPLPPARAVGIIEQVASALHAAHEVKLVHRDVKPSNILVAKDDFAYLIDFGIARAAGETGLTSTGTTIGTWAYMAPERFKKGGVADARADTYALACVLHQSLTGQQPFPGGAIEQIAVAHMLEPPPRPSELQAGVPAAMDEVIATGMAKDPEQRYATTEDLARAAREALTTPIQKPSEPVSLSTSPVQPPTQSATAIGEEVVPIAGTAGITSREPDGPPPTQYGTQADIPSGQGSATEDSGEDSFAEQSPPRWHAQLPTTESPARTEDRRATLMPPTDAASTTEALPFFRRLNRRTQIVLSAAAFFVVVSVAVAAIVLGSRSSSGGGIATSTTASTVLNNALPPSTTTPSTDPNAARLQAIAPQGYHCEAYVPANMPGSLAGLRCNADATDNPAHLVYYVMFADQRSLDDDFNRLLKGPGKQPCPGTGQVPAEWHRAATPQQAEGKLFCDLLTYSQLPDLYWTMNSQLVSGSAAGSGSGAAGLNQLYQWWAARYQ